MESLKEFLADLPIQSFKAGEVVIEQGDEDQKVYLLKKGSVEILKDEFLITEVSEELAIFGEMSILLRQPPTATVRTLEDSEFYVVEDAIEVLAWHPEAALYVAEILARRLDSLNKYLVDVKSQFKQYNDHVGMVDEVLETLMNKHPRNIERRPYTQQ